MPMQRFRTLIGRLVNQSRILKSAIKTPFQSQISRASRQIYATRLSSLTHPRDNSRNLYSAAFSSVVLFSLAATVAADTNQKTPKEGYSEVIHSEAASPTLKRVILELYPACHQDMLAVYETVGLISLLNKSLHDKPKDSLELIQRLNKYLQAILLRPKDMQRYNLNDTDYLLLIQQRLNAAYQEAGLPHPPSIHADRLRSVLMRPALWTEPLPKPVPTVDAALIMGSTYQNYFNRQYYFLKLMSTNKVSVKLGADGSFPVYLLGGDRSLDKEMDAIMIPRLVELNVALNEQNMMDVMFDQALTQYSGGVSLKRYSTHSPKEAGGRPTTAGTLDSVMRMLKDERTILVVSSAPFTRYQRLVVERQFLKQGHDITIVAVGPDLNTEMETHPRLAKEALIAITLDNLAREMYEMMLIANLKKKLISEETPVRTLSLRQPSK